MLSNFAGAAQSGSTPAEVLAPLEPTPAENTTPTEATSSTVVTPKMTLETLVTPKRDASSPCTEKHRSIGAPGGSSTHSSRKTGGATATPRSNLGNNQEFQFFLEDEIFVIDDNTGRVSFGIVTETAESYSSEDDDEEISDVLAKGEVRVAFYPEGKEFVRTEKSIGLADRTLMPGDVVRRRLPGQHRLSGQAGYVREINVRADVKVLGTKYIIRNVPSERLRAMSEWTSDAPVCLGNCIGYIAGVNECPVLKTSYGALLEINSSDFHRFKDAYEPTCRREVFNPSIFYPNNIVIGRLPPMDRITNLTPHIHLPSNYRLRALYTVQSVRTQSINVAWTFKATPQADCGSDLDPLKQPKACIKGDDLAKVKRLNVYESYLLQIHDRFYLKYSKCDKLIKSSVWEEDQAKFYRAIYLTQKQEDKHLEKPDSAGVEHEVLQSPSTPSTSQGPHSSKLRTPRSTSQRVERKAGSTDIKESQSESKSRITADESWESVEEEEDVDELQQESVEATTALASTISSRSASHVKIRNIKRRTPKKKSRPYKKMQLLRKEVDPKDGDEIVVETLVVSSTLTVVWQDGSVETGIASMDLHPIHHLDNHEFFPGDFVSNSNYYVHSQSDYGVVQSVDHDQRIAKVKWFNIYTNPDNPVPSCKEIEEISVYDLKDHPDYQYRPGTMVIRVSNFTGDDANSTAGQVIDNFPDGRVRVWWVNGHITMCYPQDLFEINQGDTQDLDESGDTEDSDSWETESAISADLGSTDLESNKVGKHIISAIDKAIEAILNLRKIIPAMQEHLLTEILNDLFSVYTGCRCLDRLLKTNFFHEDYFDGIITNKRENNIITSVPKSNDASTELPVVDLKLPQPIKVQPTSTPNKRKSSTQIDEIECKKTNAAEDATEQAKLLSNIQVSESEAHLSYNEIISKYRDDSSAKIKLARSHILLAFMKMNNIQTDKNDSGVCSRSGANSSNEDNDRHFTKLPVDTNVKLIHSDDPIACNVFCFLLKEQLDKCRELIVRKLNNSNCSEVETIDDQPNSTTNDENEQEEVMFENQLDVPMEEHALNLNTLSESLPPLESPNACSSPSAELTVPPTKPELSSTNNNCFEILSTAPQSHHFIGNLVHPLNKSQYQRAVQREYAMLHASLPPGVVVRAYEDRMDLISVMMIGPKRTPYQNALFFFDFQLGSDYPKSPPTCHYISFCTERLNPNLYEEGKVCVSLLGTWSGRDSEVWSPLSTMLQVLVSIQGLILVDEPYYNEAGYEKQRGTQLGNENSRVYNEMAIIKIAHSMIKQLQNPPAIFHQEVIKHYKEFGLEIHGRIRAWSDYSAEAQRLKITNIKDMPKDYKAPCELPEFSLLPCSRGFCVAIKGVLNILENELEVLNRKKFSKEATAPRAAPEDV